MMIANANHLSVAVFADGVVPTLLFPFSPHGNRSEMGSCQGASTARPDPPRDRGALRSAKQESEADAAKPKNDAMPKNLFLPAAWVREQQEYQPPPTRSIVISPSDGRWDD